MSFFSRNLHCFFLVLMSKKKKTKVCGSEVKKMLIAKTRDNRHLIRRFVFLFEIHSITTSQIYSIRQYFSVFFFFAFLAAPKNVDTKSIVFIPQAFDKSFSIPTQQYMFINVDALFIITDWNLLMNLIDLP